MKNKKLFVVLLVIWLVLISCAANKEMTKKDIRTVLHFIIFRSEPIGADVFIVDTSTGREVGTFGKTPVRILILKNTIEVNAITKEVICTNITPGAVGVTYGKTKAEGAEFQFKFKMLGYFDDMQIIRIPILNSNDSDIVIQVNLKSMK